MIVVWLPQRGSTDGFRTSKNIDGTVYEYILNGSQIVGLKSNDRLILYIYDETGAPIGLRYRETSYAAGVFDTYFFEKNLQGDIVAVYNSAGTKIGTYAYDACGACRKTQITSGVEITDSNNIGILNPFRYRSYYYDTNTKRFV